MEILHKDRINSTNYWGKENIDFLEDKTIVYTTHQTDGRGRLNRKWVSFDSQNLFASIILKPDGDFSKLPISNLTQLLSVVIVDVLDKYGIKTQIKWPNDVVVSDGSDDILGKKICGILAEAATSSNKIKGIVLGFGINVNASTKELAQLDRVATSMFEQTGKNFDVEMIVKDIQVAFFERYSQFMEVGFSLIKEEYMSKNNFINKNITVNMPHKSLCGVAKDINDNGAILLENNSELTTITIGEIQ